MRFREGRQGGRRVRVIASAAEGIGSNPIRGISFCFNFCYTKTSYSRSRRRRICRRSDSGVPQDLECIIALKMSVLGCCGLMVRARRGHPGFPSVLPLRNAGSSPASSISPSFALAEGYIVIGHYCSLSATARELEHVVLCCRFWKVKHSTHFGAYTVFFYPSRVLGYA